MPISRVLHYTKVIYNMSSLGEAKGMDFAASWEFVTISKEKVRIFYKKKWEKKTIFGEKFPIAQGGSL